MTSDNTPPRPNWRTIQLSTAVFALLAIAIAVVLGFAPTKVPVRPSATEATVSCGSPFAPARDAATREIDTGLVGYTIPAAQVCDDATTPRWATIVFLLLLGLLLGAVSLFTVQLRLRESERRRTNP